MPNSSSSATRGAGRADVLTTSRLSDQHPATFRSIWRIVRRNLRLVAGCAVIGALVGGIPFAFRARPYTSESSFAAQAHGATAVSALAAQFGVRAGADASESPAFYSDLLTSRAILEPMLTKHFTGMHPGFRTLQDELGRNASTPGKRHMNALSRLQAAIRPSINNATGVVTLKVTTDTAPLSQQINAALIDAVNQFNLRRRQERAAADKQFAEERLAESGADVRAAEDRLATFLEQNRTHVAPRLNLDEERLRRDVDTRQQLYTSLVQDYQRAKLDEARNDPAITVIDPPEYPLVGGSRGTVLGAALGFFLAAAAALVYVYIRAYMRVSAPDDELTPQPAEKSGRPQVLGG